MGTFLFSLTKGRLKIKPSTKQTQGIEVIGVYGNVKYIKNPPDISKVTSITCIYEFLKKVLYNFFTEWKKTYENFDLERKQYCEKLPYSWINKLRPTKEINSKNLATRTKNDLYKYLKSVLNYGTRWYNFTYNNMYSKMVNFNNPNELPKEMQYYTYEEFKQFISCEDDLMFKTLFEVLYYCGLRRGEIRGLAWEDINFENQTIYINKNIVAVKNNDKNYTISTPKTKKSKRQIPLTPSLTEHLKELYEISKKHYGFNSKWFVFGDTDPITNGRIRYRKNKIAKLAKVKQIRLHDFRHSCASLLINNGASVTLVANYLGHSKIEETLETYSHLFKSKLDELVNIIDNLN